MCKRAASVAAGLVLAAVASGGVDRIATATQDKSQADLRKAFIGTWRLISIEGGPRKRAAGPGQRV